MTIDVKTLNEIRDYVSKLRTELVTPYDTNLVFPQSFVGVL